ncbi:MAG: hypothetical protein VKJ85_01315 [Prochlorothrix sp.]|nr:hypothetical protein [Prochlorothrix sp.]
MSNPWQQFQNNSDDPFLGGLQFWLLFLVGFVLLGYSLGLAILLGIIGGFAGGYIVKCWQTEVEPGQSDADIAAAAMEDGFNLKNRSSEVRNRQEQRRKSRR